MKLTHQRMTGRYESQFPESVLDWLQQQLECRGIDAVVYTRYILSLLQDYDSDQEEEVTPSLRDVRDINGFCCQRVIKRHNSCVKENIKPVTSNKWKHRRYRTTCPDIGEDWCWPNSSDYQRKLAVVQCLKSASEQEFGIESFVDELCAKLKNIKLLAENTSDVSPESNNESNTDLTNNNNGVKVSPKEQAMKYYAAFPALSLHKCETEATLVCKGVPDVSVDHMLTTNCSDRSKWNGQKIIEFINVSLVNASNGVNEGNGCATSTANCQIEEHKDKHEVKDNEVFNHSKESNFYYCEDIESNPLDVPLVVNVDNQSPVFDGIQEENYKFERLVNKFNRNIASIWSTSELGDTSHIPKSDNIWTFDSSFSSNHSSATPSPKTCAIDLWSTLSVGQLDEKDGPALNRWTACVLKSLNSFPDDGFIDCNDIFEDDMSWPFPRITDNQLIDRQMKTKDDINKTSLQNHEKNSPFIEFKFNSNLSSNDKTLQGSGCGPSSALGSGSGTGIETGSDSLSDPLWHNHQSHRNDCQLNKLLSLASLLDESDNRLSPVIDENLLTSSKTHFQPIRQDSFEREEEWDNDFIPEITDKEVNKLIICSDKCPNNGENKVDGTDDPIKQRPISTSFGELASFMGPFNDLEWTHLNSNHSTQIMSDKSTNTDSEVTSDSKTRLSSIVETTAEYEPEYQDLYQMINEVLRNGISEEESIDSPFDDDHGDSHDTSLGLINPIDGYIGFDDCYHSDRTDDKTMAQKSIYKSAVSYLDLDSEVSAQQIVIESDASPSDYIIEDIFGDSMYKSSDDSHQLLIGHKYDWFYGQSFGEYPTDQNGHTSHNSMNAKRETFDSSLNIHYKRRPNEYVGHSMCNGLGGEWNSRLPKPCAFFIEGNCKRSDCKYSHDISAITCKYWEEGFCFKAELCPFLHGYLNEQNDETIVESVDSNDSKSYAIESESDFPSLFTKSGDNSQMGGTLFGLEADPSDDCLEKQFFGFHTKSVADNEVNCGSAKAKLPITVFMKKKLRKRKDRNLQ